MGTSSVDSILLESFLEHAMSKHFIFFIFKDGADLRIESFIVSKVCTL